MARVQLLMCLVLLIGAVLATHKGKKGSYPAGPRQVIILPAGPSVTYPWIGFGHHKGHFKGKIPYIPRPPFPSLLPPAPPPPVYQVHTYVPAAAVVPQYAPAAPQYAPAAPQYAPAAFEYAPAAPQYAPAAPQYAPAAPQYAPAAPQYAPAAPQYAPAAPVVPQYERLPPPVYATESAGFAPAEQSFPSFSDFAPAEVLIEPINSFDDSGYATFDGPEPRPIESEPVFSWGEETNPFTQEEQFAEYQQPRDIGQEEEVAHPEQHLHQLEPVEQPVVFGTSPQAGYAEAAPVAPEYAPAQEEYAPAAPEYAPAQEEYAPAAPEYALAQEEYAPAAPEYAPAQEEYAPAQEEYDPVAAGSEDFGARISPRVPKPRS